MTLDEHGAGSSRSNLPGARVLILGLGRSGTSWLMKIFDHHPMVMAIHEPELLRGRDGKPVLAGKDLPREVDRLFHCRALRAVRRRPIVPKAYRSRPAHLLRTGLIYGLSALGRLGLDRRLVRVPIPDMADLSGAHRVVKCVGSERRFAEIVETVPEVRTICIIRHPCGQIFSYLRGLRAGLMSSLYLPPRAEIARLHDFGKPAAELVEADFDILEIVALRWSVYNGMIVEAAAGRGTVRILRYEDLCADPIGEAKAAFAWAGIDWRPDCERFLRDSLEAEGDAADYHAVRRNPLVAAEKWRAEMPADDARRVTEICRRAPAAALFPDLA